MSNSKGHPKGLYVLFITEMWERFSYYGMRAILTLFMTKALLMDKELSSEIYGSYTGLVYLTPLIGGYMADRFWGNRKSIIIGGILMAIGQFFMFLSGTFYTEQSFATILMFSGLGFLIFGNGFFKPNISTMVGQLYPQGDSRVDTAFTIFYMGINLGAFLAPLVCGYFGDTGSAADFKWGYLAACIGMIISLILFIFLKNKYIVSPSGEQIGEKPNVARQSADIDTMEEVKSEFSKGLIGLWTLIFFVLLFFFKGYVALGWIGSVIFALTIAAPGLIISDKSLTKIERDRIWVIYIAAFFVIFFWAAFEQAGASLTYFAEEQTDRTLFGKTIPTSFFQIFNAAFIVLLAPLFVWLWGRLGEKNREPSSPYKQAIGLFLLALGYLFIAFGVDGLAPGVKVSMMWLIGLYVIHTFGELCLSPIGLSMVNKLAPVKFASLLMGVWFLSTAAANYFAGKLSSLYPEPVSKVSQGINSKVDILNDSTSQTISLDSNFILANQDRLPVWEVTYSSDTISKPAELSAVGQFFDNLKHDPLIDAIKGGPKDYVIKVKEVGMSSWGEIDQEIVKQVKVASGANRMAAAVSENGKNLFIIKNNGGGIDKYDITMKEKSFLGFKIKNLYDFFMLFVVMAGISAVILFILSRKLLTMMHGVR